MSNTKNKILTSSRKLLNKKGLSAVSQRTIAEYLKISPGNLTYHFKKRSDIIEALYFELVVKMDEAIANITTSESILEGLYDMMKVTMEQFYEYRFLFLDFIQIMRENKPIKTHYIGLLELREQQFTMLLQMLVDNGLMHKEELPNEYSFLLKRMYLEMSCLALYPYLTTVGKEEFKKVIKS